MFGILAGILNGAAFGRDTIDFSADLVSATNTGQFVVAIDIGAFIDLEAFKREIDRAWDTMKSSPLLPGFDEIRLPGERTHRVEHERRARGVPLHPALYRTLSDLATELDIAPL
jgi:LDH2 family malate/lactate/ureidoglycolate dehydrogenase